MKLLCLDYELCGITHRVGAIDNEYFSTNTCPECFGPAAVVEANYTPPTEEEIQQAAALGINQINRILRSQEK